MLTLSQTTLRDARPAYRPYRASVSAVSRLTPHFTRLTLTGPELDGFGTDGQDQRIKIIIPFEDGHTSDVGADDAATILDGSWYTRWRALPDDRRNPFRTYTVRAVRPESAEVDVDMVSHSDDHGAAGPALRWLDRVRIDDELVVVGPDARSIDSAIGIDWHPGAARELLLAGDETAAPAICSILESLPAGRRARAFIEVPDARDALGIPLAPGAQIIWLPRGGSPVGSALVPAVRNWVAQNPHVIDGALAASAQPLDDIDVDLELLWDSPEAPRNAGFYAWLAGEASVIKTLRRFLVSETGIDRKAVAFMGYWRLGKAEAQ
ncbi:siderophore-interacting protein [Parafrigoribacterium humi]|uniref:siderophore-interacting protein n=1 Tax=Parafrigoribacterium humi TaxID=3144664 RepID=UPI0032F03BE2